MDKSELDRYITKYPDKVGIDYKEEIKQYWDTIESVKAELCLVKDDFLKVLEENDLPEILSETGFFDTEEFYNLLIDYYYETLEFNYIRGL